MTTSYDVDLNTETVAAAWSSSPLGRPKHQGPFGFAESAETVTHHAERTVDQPWRVTKHAIVTLVLAGGIAAGAALGLMSVDLASDRPIAVVPAAPAPHPAVIVAPSVHVSSPIEGGRAAPAPVPAPVRATATIDAPAAGVDVPAKANPWPAPDLPAKEEPVDPQPPLWHPDLDFKFPLPQPVPAPPVFHPDLPKAPLPGPEPVPPSMPDFEISAGPGS